MSDHGHSYSEDIARVRTRLLDLETSLTTQGHSQAWFVALYWTTTSRCKWLVEGIARPDHPRHDALRGMDPRLIRDIVVYFEPRYTERLHSSHEGKLEQDDPWQPVFQNSTKSGPFTTMLLGAYTHIAFDLPMVLSRKLASGQRMYDPGDPKQVFTFRKLNYWFALDIGRAATRVCRVNNAMPYPVPCALVGSLRSRHLRQWTMPVWKMILAGSRRQAEVDARLLANGDLNEAGLAMRVHKNNLHLIKLIATLTPKKENTERHSPTAVGTALHDG